MQWIKLPVGLASSPIARKVEQRYGLVGYARLLKVIETWACSRDASLGVVELPMEDWQGLLHATPADVRLFFNYLTTASWLTWSEPAPGSLRVTLRHCIDWIPEAELGLYAKPEQWAAWAQSELGMTAADALDPYTFGLFRHWCASNVTVNDAMAALTSRLDRGESVTPAGLHDELISQRRRRLERAKEQIA